MTKHYVKWHQVQCRNISGHDYLSGIPEIIDHGYRGTLLTRILQMYLQKPITFDEAIRLAHDKIYISKIGHGRGESHWYMDHFVEWISELGYHIDLMGDEFTAVVAPEKAI